MRPLVQFGVTVALIALATRTWLLMGVVDPAVVSGGSMAPALLGAHRQVTCHACTFRFACGEELVPVSLEAICPNCGALNGLADLPARRGDRLLVDRATYSLGRPRRWDVAVLDAPDDAGQLCVKRVVGLPGECVEIRDGDLLVDGQPVRRSLRQLLAMAVPVHDARCRAESAGSIAWQPERADSHWSHSATGFATQPKPRDAPAEPEIDWPEVDWLVFEYRPVSGGPPSEPDPPAPILDDLAYNQDESRALIAVPDVLIRCRLEADGAGDLWLEANDGRGQFFIQLAADSGHGVLRSGGKPLAEFEIGIRALAAPTDLVLALADAELRLSLDGRLVLEHSYDAAGLARRPTPRPLAIGSAVLGLRISDLRVLRDVYYLPAPHPTADAPRAAVFPRLGADQYWLLGDNSSVSIDSRSWSAVDGKAFIGKVLLTPK